MHLTSLLDYFIFIFFNTSQCDHNVRIKNATYFTIQWNLDRTYLSRFYVLKAADLYLINISILRINLDLTYFLLLTKKYVLSRFHCSSYLDGMKPISIELGACFVISWFVQLLSLFVRWRSSKIRANDKKLCRLLLWFSINHNFIRNFII